MYFNHLCMSGIYEPSCSVISTILDSKTVIVLVTNKSRFSIEWIPYKARENIALDRRRIMIPTL